MQEGIALPIVKFTGSSKDNTDPLENIWNGLKVGDGSYVNQLNDSLGLRNPELAKYKDKLLENGNQKEFNWNLLGKSYPEDNQHTKTRFKITDTGIIIDGYYLMWWKFRYEFLSKFY
ncbi:hypothetical protein [Spiroplasma taiwanense]|uniref:Uncharacterized protein n=1 Tax=Spiroplasma taiwanense CT-1 TaxID=1276220 RepID=S5LX29_9MOLU|nr:hypothetical protein [Spiroplasma taiwanense]AGR41176.1 hypothetical protein STAIW_v1c05510 [Spiroplasma taiwanense CT-1]